MQSSKFLSADGGDMTASRRRFLQTMLAGGTVAGLGLMPRMSWSAAPALGNANELRGTDFKLSIGEMPVDFTGARRTGFEERGQVDFPISAMARADMTAL